MAKDDEIDDQVSADLEFTRRAEQLMFKLRTQGKTGPPAADQEDQKEGQKKETPPEDK